MEARKKTQGRKTPTMKMGRMLPTSIFKNPLKGGTKVAVAGVTTMKKGVGVYFRVRF